MNKLSLKDELDEGRAVDVIDFGEGPVVAHGPTL
jgi:hypothetical protein